MLYLVAIIIPPLGLLLCGKPFQAIISLIFWVLAWVFSIFLGAGVVMWLILAAHAVFIVRDRNTRKMMEEVASGND